MVGVSLLVLDVQVELLQVHGTLLIAVIFQLYLCLHELHRPVISLDDPFHLHNVILPLSTCLHNVLHLFVVGGVSMNNIR